MPVHRLRPPIHRGALTSAGRKEGSGRMSELCLRRQLKTRSLVPRALCKTAQYLRKCAQWKTLMVVVRAQSGLENYTFLARGVVMKKINVSWVSGYRISASLLRKLTLSFLILTEYQERGAKHRRTGGMCTAEGVRHGGEGGIQITRFDAQHPDYFACPFQKIAYIAGL
jgi:hypothetical protein